MDDDQQGLISRVGPVEIDWFQSLGYYGGLGVAIAAGVIEPPVGIFIAAIPFMKMLRRPNSPFMLRAISDTLEGASKPVGGDSEGVIKVNSSGGKGSRSGGSLTTKLTGEVRGVWREARLLADGSTAPR